MALPPELLDSCPELTTPLLHAYRGSIAHGMYVPSDDPDSIDDKDTMAFVVAPRAHYLGLEDWGSSGTVEIKLGEWDVVLYELRKAIRLLLQGNPNVLSMLWVPENYVLGYSWAGKALRENRDWFSGRHVYPSFVGYATAQLRKMESGVHRGYMGERRKALVERHGFDTKNAAHLVRLLRMGIEFLRDGELRVDRGGLDATELLAIKRGEWSLDRVKGEAERLFRRAEEAHDRSTLPPRPDRTKVEELLVEILAAELERDT